MEALLQTPVTLKVLASLGLILLLNRLCRKLMLAVALATLLLAVWCGHPVASIGRIAWDRFAGLSNLFLMFVVLEVVWLSSQMSATGMMKDLVRAVRARVPQRAALAILPAVIGMLPMPGGAAFSAPLVDDCDTDNAIDPLLKTKVNYWFRHIWEYWWPLFPGVLLAMEISGIEIWRFILLQFPLGLLSAGLGYLFLLRRVPTRDRLEPRPPAHGPILPLLTPIGVVVLVYALVMTTCPVCARISRYLPMGLGLLVAMFVLQLLRPLDRAAWRKILLSPHPIGLALLVAVLRVYGAFIEAELPGGELLVARMRVEIDALGVPLVAMIMLMPFLCGISTGIAIGFVGGGFPIVLSLIGEDPAMAVRLSTVMLAYGAGHMGQMLSPIHVCLLVTNEHFKTGLMRSLWRLVPLALAMLLGTFLLSRLVLSVLG